MCLVCFFILRFLVALMGCMVQGRACPRSMPPLEGLGTNQEHEKTSHCVFREVVVITFVGTQ